MKTTSLVLFLAELLFIFPGALTADTVIFSNIEGCDKGQQCCCQMGHGHGSYRAG
ncbi:MAG: hypothetical protein K8S62_00630 [Candidatus Sabulitectum sp.]|nr:hypothetical protein [Candidatus Sabulitectum sp.]